MKIPLRQVTTLFLDVGNTMISVDFPWICEELDKRGVSCAPAALRRAEAAAGLSEADLDDLALDLAPALRPPGSTSADLWSYVLPGVEDALIRFKRAGLSLSVISNADGSIDASLTRRGLRDYFDLVVDSAVIGVEKPDPKIFHHALSKTGAAAHETLYVGDIFDVDVVGATAAGLHAVLLDPFGDWDHVDCDRVTDLTELAGLIEDQKR